MSYKSDIRYLCGGDNFGRGYQRCRDKSRHRVNRGSYQSYARFRHNKRGGYTTYAPL